jgi:hypothetical protein
MSVNKFMPKITPLQQGYILYAANYNEIYPNSTLPKKLVDYLISHISDNAFKDENNNGLLDTKSQFGFD